MLAPRDEGVDPHHIRKSESRVLQHRLDIAEAKLRLLLDSPRHAVGRIDPELARADQDAMSRRDFDAVAVARERGADGFGGDVPHRTGAIPYPVRRIERVRWRKDASGASGNRANLPRSTAIPWLRSCRSRRSSNTARICRS